MVISPRMTPHDERAIDADARVSSTALARALERAFAACWGVVPALRAPSSPRARELDDALRECERIVAIDRDRGRGRRNDDENDDEDEKDEKCSPSSSSSHAEAGGERARHANAFAEHWAVLRALDAQLARACAAFASDDDCGYTYDAPYDVVREWNGVVLEAKACKPRLRSARGLTTEEYAKVVGASQWIRGVLEGGNRILLLSVEAMAMPMAWQRALPTNAKELVGINLYNDLSAEYGFDAEALADRERYWGGDAPESDGAMGVIEAWTTLDSLEKAEAIWSSKMKEQQNIDAASSVQLWGHGARAKALSKRLRNSSAYRRVLYQRYPNVEFTSLQQMKISKNEDLASAALAAYAGGLVRVASALRDRAMDVIDAHHAAVGTLNPFRKRPQPPGVLDMLLSTSRLTSEWAYDWHKSIEKSLDDAFATYTATGKARSCCAAAPSSQSVADRSPASIHFINDSDSDDDR